MRYTVLTVLLYGAGALWLGLTVWRHWAVVRFFRRAVPDATRPVHTVSILQPILAGDPTLPLTLAHNLEMKSDYPLEFVWLVDEDDSEAQGICAKLAATHPHVQIQRLLLPAPPQGVNPKTAKLIAGLPAAGGDVVCVLDDDTMLPDHGLETCLPWLDQPGIGLAFGLPYQVNFANLWSGLIAVFVNSNSLLTYVPFACVHEPITINGMFYALRRETLTAIGDWQGIEHVLADDFAIAQRVRSHGLRLAQTPLRHAIRTQVPSLRRYMSLMQRWFIFPRESILRHLPWSEQALVYGLAMLPAMLPLTLLLGLLLLPGWGPAALIAGGVLYSNLAFVHLDRKYLGGATPWAWTMLAPVLQVVFPLQLLAALLLPQRITWRGHIMQVQRGGGFMFIKRR